MNYCYFPPSLLGVGNFSTMYMVYVVKKNGSTDNSSAIVHSYNDPRIRLIQNNHNYIGSLNLLLKEAKGKYIARMDADDRMYPNRLQVQFDYMESHPKVDILGSGMQCFGENEATCEPYRTGEVGVLEFMECCAIYHPTVMMRKASIDAADMAYKQEYIYAEDYGFWAEALAKGLTIANIPDILLEYRVNPFQVSKTKRTYLNNCTCGTTLGNTMYVDNCNCYATQPFTPVVTESPTIPAENSVRSYWPGMI